MGDANSGCELMTGLRRRVFVFAKQQRSAKHCVERQGDELNDLDSPASDIDFAGY
jgi:hypothetical protein